MVRLVIFFLLMSINSIAQVEIKNSTALYYLEIEDKYYLELAKDTMQIELIQGLRTESELKSKIIDSYQVQKEIQQSIIETQKEQITLNKKEVKRLRRDRTKERVGFGLIIVLILLI